MAGSHCCPQLPAPQLCHPHPGAEAMAWATASAACPCMSLRCVAIGENCPILGKATGSLVAFATLSSGCYLSTPPTCPSHTATHPLLPRVVPSAPFVPSHVLPACLGVLPWDTVLHRGVWVLLAPCGHQPAAWPCCRSGPPQRCWEAQRHFRAWGTEGHRGHSASCSLVLSLASCP